MANNTLSVRHKMACRPHNQWITPNPTPLRGEICIETIGENYTESNPIPDFYKNYPDNVRIKIGNGSSTYNDLPYLDTSFVLRTEYLNLVASAMRYRGTASNTSTITGDSNAKNGDVWKASASFTIGSSITVNVGDTIIVKIDNGTTSYDVIPSGDDIEYRPIKVEGRDTLNDQVSSGYVDFSSSTTINTPTTSNPSHIELTTETVSESGNVVGKKIKIAHKKQGNKDTTISKDADDKKYISSVEVDDLGHIRSVGQTDIPVIDIEGGSTNNVASATEWINVTTKSTTIEENTLVEPQVKVISHKLQNLGINGSNTTKTIGTNSTTTNASSVTIPKITIDKAGHITAASETIVNLLDTTYSGVTSNPVIVNNSNHTVYLDTLHYESDGTTPTTISGGSSTSIPTITVDRYGRVTSITPNNITVGNAKLTLNVGGQAVTGNNTFTANSSTDTTYNVPIASSSALGVVKGGSDGTSTNNRVYGVSVDASGAMTTTVPWIKYSVSNGLKFIGDDIQIDNSITAGTISGSTGTVAFGDTVSIPSITYSANGLITSTTTTSITLPNNLATATTAGLVKVNNVLTTAPTINLTNTSDRYYGIEIDSNGKLVVNVPWTDKNAEYNIIAGTSTSIVNATATNPYLNLVNKANNPNNVESSIHLIGGGYSLYDTAVPNNVQKIVINSGTNNLVTFKANLHKVAVTGNWSDLIDTPRLHVVNFYSRFSTLTQDASGNWIWTGAYGTSLLGSYNPAANTSSVQDIFLDVPGSLSDLVNDLQPLKITGIDHVGQVAEVEYNGSIKTEILIVDERTSPQSWRYKSGASGSESLETSFKPAIEFSNGTNTVYQSEVSGIDSDLLRQRVGDVLILDGNF